MVGVRYNRSPYLGIDGYRAFRTFAGAWLWCRLVYLRRHPYGACWIRTFPNTYIPHPLTPEQA